MKLTTFSAPSPNQIITVNASAYFGVNKYRIENRTSYTLYIAASTLDNVDAIRNSSLVSVLALNSLTFDYNSGFTGSITFTILVDDSGFSPTLPPAISTEINFIEFSKFENADETNNSNLLGLLNPSTIDTPPNYPNSPLFSGQNQSVTTPAIDLVGWNGFYISIASVYNQTGTFNTAPLIASFQFADNLAFSVNVITTFIHAGSNIFGYIPKVRRFARVLLQNSPVWPATIISQGVYVSARRYQSDVVLAVTGADLHYDSFHVSPVPLSVNYTFYIPVNPPITRIVAYSDQTSQLRLQSTASQINLANFYTLTILTSSLAQIDIPVAQPLFIQCVTNSSALTRQIQVTTLRPSKL